MKITPVNFKGAIAIKCNEKELEQISNFCSNKCSRTVIGRPVGSSLPYTLILTNGNESIEAIDLKKIKTFKAAAILKALGKDLFDFTKLAIKKSK